MKQNYTEVNEGDFIRFRYTNWKGVTTVRKAIVNGFFFGKTEFHEEFQGFIKAFDLDKWEHRDFAVKDISAIEKVERP